MECVEVVATVEVVAFVEVTTGGIFSAVGGGGPVLSCDGCVDDTDGDADDIS